MSLLFISATLILSQLLIEQILKNLTQNVDNNFNILKVYVGHTGDILLILNFCLYLSRSLNTGSLLKEIFLHHCITIFYLREGSNFFHHCLDIPAPYTVQLQYIWQRPGSFPWPWYVSGTSLDQLTTQRHLIVLHVTNPPTEVSETRSFIGFHSDEQHIENEHTSCVKPERWEGGSQPEDCHQEEGSWEKHRSLSSVRGFTLRCRMVVKI